MEPEVEYKKKKVEIKICMWIESSQTACSLLGS
jgi:hypothetical protein